MSQKTTLRYTIITAVLALCLIVTACLIFCVSPLKAVRDDKSLGSDGKAITSVSVADLPEVGIIPFVNYTPGKYLIPNVEIQGDAVDLRTFDNFAERGTFVYVFSGLASDEEYQYAQQAFAPYLHSDYRWHFTLYIPKIWSACCVYVNDTLITRVGSMTDYNFANYLDFEDSTSTHINKTQPLFIDLPIDARAADSGSASEPRLTVVTIHYEAAPCSQAGIDGLPLIGGDTVITNITDSNNTLGVILCVMAALITAIFLFVCLLKKRLSFLPHLFIVFGVFCVLACATIMSKSTSLPYFWQMARSLSVAFTLLSALMATRSRKCLCLWRVVFALGLLYCLTIPVLYLLPVNVCAWESTYKICCIAFFSAAILIFVYINAANKKNDLLFLVNPLLVAVLGLTFCLTYTNFFAVYNASYWLCVAILLYTAYLGGNVFINQEQRLNYLTDNLQAEVQFQTNELKKLVHERDELFRYISHDMKKPLSSMEYFLCVAKQREKDDEQKKLLEILGNKMEQLSRNFAELSAFAKNNFTAEESRSFPLDDLLQQVKADLEPDCCANGINLKVAPCRVNVYGKYNTLYSVVSNIILNAIEHSGCKNIFVSATRKKNVCTLAISDDGKGIPEGKDVFYPYYSESPGKNNAGIGLYLSRSFIHSMNGELTYKQADGMLTFYITLPVA